MDPRAGAGIDDPPLDVYTIMTIRHLTRRTLLRSLAAAAAMASGAPASAGPAASRWWSSIVWVVFENHPYSQVAGLPSHRRLAAEGTVFTRYFAVGHPSGPNYRAMASGELWGRAEVVDAFHPTVASAGATALPPIPTFVYHLAGEIARRHDPFVDLHAPIAGTRTGLEAFRADLDGGTSRLPNRCLVYAGWDDDNDMHNRDIARADANLTALLDALAASPWFSTADGAGRYPALFFCYDEDDGTGNNRVFAALWGRGVRPGLASPIRHTHFGFCRTVSDNWGLPVLGRAANEAPIAEAWL
jgi:phosphatidylinositol-3-phosphatase